MKKLLALIVALAMCMSFACAETAEDDLADAKSYLYLMYKNSTETTMTDYTVVGVLNIGGVEYPVEWTTDSDTIKVVPGDDKMVTIDVDEKNPEEVHYVLTATIKGADDKTATVSFKHKVPAAIILDAGMSYEEIVDAAYSLEEGLTLEDTFRLYGTITEIKDAYSEKYQNITVIMQVGELADKPITCFRLSGEGADKLAVGDDITVEGTFKNYKGTIEFDKGCKLIGRGEIKSQAAILDAAYALEDGVSMPAPTVLSGEIVTIKDAYSEKYQNITVIMVCDGKEDQPIMCFRLSGEGADKLAVGDKIAVAGTIKNYKGTIEFDKGCKLIPVESADDVRMLQSVYTLEEGLSMTEQCTMTGVITKIDSPYSEKYKNLTVIMTVGGMEDMPLMAFRLSGEGAAELAEGDTITVTGTIKNYKGTIEFDKGCTLDAVVKAN